MDPQRQYARLLTLWAESAKSARRMDHLAPGRWPREWDPWWRLGRRLVERGMDVLPVPGVFPVLLVAWDQTAPGRSWAALVDAGDAQGRLVYRHAIRIALAPDAPALEGDRLGWLVSRDLALLLGARLWRTLIEWPDHPCGRWPENDQALAILGALAARPAAFRQAPTDDWSVLARLWRHRGIPQRIPSWHQDPPYRWVHRVADRYVWPSQDEDSVH
ncbi:MAG: hypothetical protein M0Z53_15760 [Thermaerobacter sp.]|nr:hypothetical protein [Thermaerobacter sp.]